jgi:hypothetical protein
VIFGNGNGNAASTEPNRWEPLASRRIANYRSRAHTLSNEIG